jgi:hypothetical protein
MDDVAREGVGPSGAWLEPARLRPQLEIRDLAVLRTID